MEKQTYTHIPSPYLNALKVANSTEEGRRHNESVRQQIQWLEKHGRGKIVGFFGRLLRLHHPGE